MKKLHLKYVIGFVCLQSFFVFSQKKENTVVTNSQIRGLFSKNRENCIGPTYINTKFMGNTDKVVSINNANQVDFKNNQNASLIVGNIFEYNNYGNTQINYSFSEKFYTPEKSEAIYRETLEKVLNKKIDSVFKNNSDLNDKITNWDYISNTFSNALEKLEDHDPIKKIGFDLLKKYTENISTAKCLNEDYGDQAIIETDSNGNKSYSFDLEKIKNDPNYFFIGEEVNGFRIIKKRNKYGYVNNLDNSIEKVNFKYDYAENYHPSGFAVAGDKEYVYLIDENGNEKFRFYNSSNSTIKIINNNRFLIQKNQGSFILDQNGNEIIHSNFIIHPTNLSNEYFVVLDSISARQINQIKYGYPIIEDEQHKNKLAVLDYYKSDEKALINFYLCDLNGKNISEKYENDKKITSLLNCSVRNYKKEDSDFLILKSAVNIPNSDYIFLYFVKTKKLTSHYVILDSKSNVVHFSDFGTAITFAHGYNFFPIKELADNTKYESTADLIIGCQYTQYFKKGDKKRTRVSLDNLTINKLVDLDNEKKMLILNLTRQRFIDGENQIGFDNIIGTTNQNKTIIVSVKNEEGDFFYGAIDYNGLYVVPPIMKQMEFKNDGGFYDVKTNKDDSIYELNSLGNCIKGDCKKYNQIIRAYFENENKN